MDGKYNPLKHEKANNAIECLVECLETDGVKKIGDVYKISLMECEEYISRAFSNLPSRTVRVLLDQLILCGALIPERDAISKRWVVTIRAR